MKDFFIATFITLVIANTVLLGLVAAIRLSRLLPQIQIWLDSLSFIWEMFVVINSLVIISILIAIPIIIITNRLKK